MSSESLINQLANFNWHPLPTLEDEKVKYFYYGPGRILTEDGNNTWKKDEHITFNNIRISKISKEKDKNDIVVAYDKDSKKEIGKFKSQGEASRKLDVGQGLICDSIKKGYIVKSKYIFELLKNQPPLEKNIEEILEELEKSCSNSKEFHFTLNGKIFRIKKHRLILFHIKKEKVVCKFCNKTEHESTIDCDHIDGNENNNDIDNLQPLCKSCHSKKTNEQTRESRKKSKRTTSLISVTKTIKDDEIEYTKNFDSIDDCRRYYYDEKTDNDTEKFWLHSTYLKKNIPIYEREFENFSLKFEIVKDHFSEDDENGKEEWRGLDSLEKFKGKNTFVSNYGRIKGPFGLTNGSLHEEYYRYGGFRVHQLVLLAFNHDLVKKAMEIQEKYKDTSIDDIMSHANEKYSIVVDHINKDKKDNRLSNLRYYTLSENARNTSRNYKVNQYSLDFQLIKTYSSLVEAAEKLNLKANYISRACNDSSRKIYKNFIFMREDHVNNFENPKDAYIDLKGKESLPDCKDDIWKARLNEYTKFRLDNDNKKPSRSSKNENEKSLEIWAQNNNRNYKNKMSDERKKLWSTNNK